MNTGVVALPDSLFPETLNIFYIPIYLYDYNIYTICTYNICYIYIHIYVWVITYVESFLSLLKYSNACYVLVILKLGHMWDHLNGWLQWTPGPTTRVSDSGGLAGRLRMCVLTSSQLNVMLPVWDHSLRITPLDAVAHVTSITCPVNRCSLDFKSIVIFR